MAPIGSAFRTVSSVANRGPAIPNSVVSRPADNNTVSDTNTGGLEFSTSQEWSDFQAEISGNCSGMTRAYIDESDGTRVADTDVSGLSSGDVVTFSGVSLTANLTYLIYMDAEGGTWTQGFNGSPSFPYTSSDGNLEITSGYYADSTVTGSVNGFVTIGNITL